MNELMCNGLIHLQCKFNDRNHRGQVANPKDEHPFDQFRFYFRKPFIQVVIGNGPFWQGFSLLG